MWAVLIDIYCSVYFFSFLTNYDAIIRSTLFRRLQDKAQVFPLDNDDYVRTRLTHSLEVSAIGKELGRRVFSALQARHVNRLRFRRKFTKNDSFYRTPHQSANADSFSSRRSLLKVQQHGAALFHGLSRGRQLAGDRFSGSGELDMKTHSL